MRRMLQALAANTRGATTIEYGLILALIFLAMILAVTAVATATDAMWGNVQEAQEEVVG